MIPMKKDSTASSKFSNLHGFQNCLSSFFRHFLLQSNVNNYVSQVTNIDSNQLKLSEFNYKGLGIFIRQTKLITTKIDFVFEKRFYKSKTKI